MGIRHLQDFLEANCTSACVSVDLLKISRGFVPKRRGRNPGPGRFCLVVDAESCLDRLYGGYFSDWVCGGQWNRMTTFLSNLIQACHNANMELVLFFNGALESQKMSEWNAEQINIKRKAIQNLKHVGNKGTPPPKVWWIPPVYLRGALRMALHHLGVTVAVSSDDHQQEVIGYCREHGLQGILAQEAVYVIFDPPRYFSSKNLKLTFKGSLETKEFIMDEIAKNLNLNPNRFTVFAALLGNHLLPDEDLYDFFKELLAKKDPNKPVKPSPENAIKAVVEFVRDLPKIDDLDEVGELVFRNSRGNKAALIAKFKESVQYYMNGTHGGFLKYGKVKKPGPKQNKKQNGSGDNQATQIKNGIAGEISKQMNNVENQLNNLKIDDTAGANHIDATGDAKPAAKSTPSKPKGNKKNKAKKTEDFASKIPSVTPEIIRIASERHHKGLMSPWIYQLLSQGELKLPCHLEDDTNRELPSTVDFFRPLRLQVYSVLFNLNKLKLLHDKQQENKDGGEIKSFEVPVKEWVVRRGNHKPTYETVIAHPLDWRAPSIERMWLGQDLNDKNQRLRAFLTCMMCPYDGNALMLNSSYVPQHLLLPCTVLRYMIEQGRVLQRAEIDAFLAMCVSPLLHDVQTMQDLKLPNIHIRGIMLGSLFMSGIEHAIFANDVCGAPIAPSMCCPWLFYDGKLFHFKLLKAYNNTPLIDICDGAVDQVLRVERMRQAVMEGMQRIEFAKPPLPTGPMYGEYPYPPPYMPMNFRPAGAGIPPLMSQHFGRGRGFYNRRPPPYGPPMPPQGPQKGVSRGRGLLGRSPIDTRGGQLEIAGVVVGSWGPNLSGRGRGVSPQVMSVGGMRRYQQFGRRPARGPMMPGRPMKGGRIGPVYGGFPRPLMRQHMQPGPRGFYPGRTKPVRPVFNRRNVQLRPNSKKKKVAAKSPGKGRGVTVEASGTKPGSQQNGFVKTMDEVDDQTDVYEDAEVGNDIATPMAVKGVVVHDIAQSPDSGIHGDKSATDLNITA